MIRSALRQFAACFSSYSSIFFLGHEQLGMAMAVVTLLHFEIGAMGLLALVFAHLMLGFFQIGHTHRFWMVALINSLLVGLYMGHFFGAHLFTMGVLFVAVAFVLIFTTLLDSFLVLRQLPLLSLPFSLVAILLSLLNMRGDFLIDHSVYFVAIGSTEYGLASSFLSALGSIFCVPDTAIGVMLFALLFISSRVTALFAVLGFLLAQSFEWLFHLSPDRYGPFNADFNFILAFVAVAAVIMVPSKRSIVVGTVVVAFGVFIMRALDMWFAPFHLGSMALPFNVTVLLTLLTLRGLAPHWLAPSWSESPEKCLEQNWLLWNRHRWGEPGVYLPLDGEVQVQQGFDGGITHRGFWRHALDFVQVDDKNKPFKGRGLELEEHYVYGKKIYSPIDGFVVQAYDQDDDNLIGQVVNKKNWGNSLILRANTGFSVTLAHLKKSSLEVKVGDFVTAGQSLAAVGNTGYSQEPHLHFQGQWLAEVGAYTTPFHLLNYAEGNRLVFHGVPSQGAIIHAPKLNIAVDRMFNFKVGDSMRFRVENREVEMVHQVDELSGRFYWSDGKSKVYYQKNGIQFYFYGLEGDEKSALWDLFLAAPRVPMTYGRRYSFVEDLPLLLTQSQIRRTIGHLAQILMNAPKNLKGEYEISETGLSLKGRLGPLMRNAQTDFEVDPVHGILRFSVEGRAYERILAKV